MPTAGRIGAGPYRRTPAAVVSDPTTVPRVDIEEFYDADERRRRSAELELGRDWKDDHGVRYELNWVEDTGELYVMREPVPHDVADPFGGIHVGERTRWTRPRWRE